MNQEQFIAKIQAQQRILIPIEIYQIMKLKQGHKVRIIIKKVG